MEMDNASLFLIEKTVLDKALPETHKAVLATLLKHENKMYPGALAKAAKEDTGQDISVPAMVKIIKSLMDKELVKEVTLSGIVTPSNISGYYALTRRGLFLATFWAKENGVPEIKIQDTIEKCLYEYNYPESIVNRIIQLRKDIIQFRNNGILSDVS